MRKSAPQKLFEISIAPINNNLLNYEFYCLH